MKFASFKLRSFEWAQNIDSLSTFNSNHSWMVFLEISFSIQSKHLSYPKQKLVTFLCIKTTWNLVTSQCAYDAIQNDAGQWVIGFSFTFGKKLHEWNNYLFWWSSLVLRGGRKQHTNKKKHVNIREKKVWRRRDDRLFVKHFFRTWHKNRNSLHWRSNK